MPNVAGYNAKIALTECIQDALVQHRSDIDGTGNFYWTELMSGPKDASDSDPATDYYHVLFIVSVKRQKVR